MYLILGLKYTRQREDRGKTFCLAGSDLTTAQIVHTVGLHYIRTWRVE